MSIWNRNNMSTEAEKQNAVALRTVDAEKVLQFLYNLGYQLTETSGQRRLRLRYEWNMQTPISDCEVFVGKIPWHIFEYDLFPTFWKIGHIYEMRLMMDMAGSNRGFCFVTFMDKDSAQRAIALLNRYEIFPGKKICVYPSLHNCRISISQLPNSLNGAIFINKIYETIKDVKTVTVYRYINGDLKNAVITFASHYSASIARRSLFSEWNDVFRGSELVIQWALPNRINYNLWQECGIVDEAGEIQVKKSLLISGLNYAENPIILEGLNESMENLKSREKIFFQSGLLDDADGILSDPSKSLSRTERRKLSTLLYCSSTEQARPESDLSSNSTRGLLKLPLDLFNSINNPNNNFVINDDMSGNLKQYESNSSPSQNNIGVKKAFEQYNMDFNYINKEHAIPGCDLSSNSSKESSSLPVNSLNLFDNSEEYYPKNNVSINKDINDNLKHYESNWRLDQNNSGVKKIVGQYNTNSDHINEMNQQSIQNTPENNQNSIQNKPNCPSFAFYHKNKQCCPFCDDFPGFPGINVDNVPNLTRMNKYRDSSSFKNIFERNGIELNCDNNNNNGNYHNYNDYNNIDKTSVDELNLSKLSLEKTDSIENMQQKPILGRYIQENI